MRIFLSAKRFGLFLISFALFAGLVAAPPANAISGPNSSPNSDSLFSSAVVSSPESLGRVERDAVKAARAHLVNHALEWGIDSAQFQPSEAIEGVGGISTVRFTQWISGVEVANSLLAVTVNKVGSLLSYTKSISDSSGVTESSITNSEAVDLLKSKLAKQLGTSADQVVVSESKLVIVDSALVDNVASGQYLAWRASTSILNNVTSISMTYLSEDGQNVLSSLPLLRGITAEPFVCDLQIDGSTPGYILPAGVMVDINNNRFVNIAGGGQALPLCGPNNGLNSPNTEIGKQNIIRTWDYFSSVLGQDINEEKYLGNIAPTVNGDATPRISAYIDICATNGTTGTCPYGNAFWVPWSSTECSSGACSGIFLGKNFDHADDVIAHELSHGVTFSLAFRSAMADTSETAALSEAISDIFGEAMDQLSVIPGEVADPKWTMGEDAQAGGYRNLQDPTVSKIGKNWTPTDSHENSGPVNRLAYVLANGGKIGKVKVKALGSDANASSKDGLCDVAAGECLGIVRMSQLVFATTSNLTATANYFDFGKQMMNACSAFIANGTAGFKKATCKNVAAALKAQGFTNLKISGMTKLGKAAKGVDTIITANVSGTTGAPVVGQEMQLQIKRGGKWKTYATSNSDGAGVVGFVAAWNNSATYRIITKTNDGVFAATGKSAKVKVK